MLIVYGTGFYGKVRRCAGTCVATRFFHVSFLPLVPLGSHLVIQREGQRRSLPARANASSILAAYLRTWGVLGGAALLFTSVGLFAEGLEERAVAQLLLAPLLLVATVVAVVGSFAWLGRLSSVEKAQQAVYARFVGAPIDPVLLGERRGDVRRAVESALLERAPAIGIAGYRSEGLAGADWTQLALSPAVRDVDFLESALTLARLEWAEAPRAERAARAERHQAIWQRLDEQRTTRGAGRATAIAA